MMTIPSIDATTGELPLGEMQTDCAAAVPQTAVDAFGKTMAELTARNAALGQDLDLALRCVREVLNREELSAIPKTSDPVLPPLPEQVAKSLELGRELESAARVVNQVTAQVVSTTPEPVADETPVAREVPVQIVQETSVQQESMPPLPAQVAKTLELGRELESAAQVVSQVATQLVSTTPEQVANPVATQVVSTTPEPVADETPVAREVPVQVVQETSVQQEPMPPLPAQVAKTLELGRELESAAQVVSQVATQAVSATPGQVANPVATQVVSATPEPVADETPVAREVPVQVVQETSVQREPIPPLPVQVTKTLELGQELESAAQVVSQLATQLVSKTPEVTPEVTLEGTPEETPDETSEVTAEALVAAGVTVRAPVREASEVAPSAAPSVAPVDIVRQQATEAVPSAVLVQAAEAVADALLVSPGLLRGQGEVIVRLRPDVLEGTEVGISVTGRQLEVVFRPQTVDMAVMIENCRTQIVNHLAAKIVSFNVSVDVRKKRT